MNTVIPVEIQKTAPDGTPASATLFQAFTRDVSPGGMCLEIKSFGPETESLFNVPEAHFLLTINPPFTVKPIQAVARVAWVQREDKFLPVQYRLGMAYTQIDAKSKRRIVNYAKRLLWVPRLAAFFGILLIVTLLQTTWQSQKMIGENKNLVREIVSGAEKRSQDLKSLNDLSFRKSALEKDLAKANGTIKELEASLALMSTESESSKVRFQEDLKAVAQKQQDIVKELTLLQEDRQKVQSSVILRQTTESNKAISMQDQLIGWLGSHQNQHTGLVASFEGDASIENHAFTYDQALSCQAFLLFHQNEKAAAILKFYNEKAGKKSGAFFNSYDTTDGSVAESMIHTGPNLWLGLSAAHYEKQMGDGKFLALAEGIGQWAIDVQDEEGGVKGGPELTWYSTEHNLDAYAFFGALYELTRDGKYRLAQEKVLAWIQKYAYSVREKRMNRGKGDSAIATDTFSWAVSAIGPAKLNEIGFDAEEIMAFAKEHCETTVDLVLSGNKKVKVTGFDFSKAKNLGRGGIISTEWTAQVVVSYRVLAEYFSKMGETEKAAAYSEKVQFYLNELQKLLITSPSRVGQGRGCLPYASEENVDTGHGWRTPRGRTTGSVAGTAYALFAWKGFNPFELGEES